MLLKRFVITDRHRGGWVGSVYADEFLDVGMMGDQGCGNFMISGKIVAQVNTRMVCVSDSGGRMLKELGILTGIGSTDEYAASSR